MKKVSRVLSAVTLLFSLASCAPVPKTIGQLDPAAAGPTGYSKAGPTGVFENRDVRLTVRQIRGTEADDAFVKSLIDRDYIVLALSIENNSASKVIFDPVHAALFNDIFDYRKPLDHTDLYDLQADDNDFRRLRGRFYDLSTTVPPGGSASKYLIFKTLSGEARKITLSIKDLYIGTNSIRVDFPFIAEVKAK